MTKDLALAIHGKDLKRAHYSESFEFLGQIDETMRKMMSTK